SRRRHTRSKRDWSSDVCSSDLATRDPRRRKVKGGSHKVGVSVRHARETLGRREEIAVPRRPRAARKRSAQGMPVVASAELSAPKIGRASGRERGESGGGSAARR